MNDAISESTSAGPSPLLDQAVSWARSAGALTLEWFNNPSLEIDSKSDGSPVTQADKAAERHLRELISQAYPDDTIEGEEEETVVGTSDRRWLIDPIDGTKAFAHGVGTYSNLLYAEDSQGPLLGVINLPALGETRLCRARQRLFPQWTSCERVLGDRAKRVIFVYRVLHVEPGDVQPGDQIRLQAQDLGRRVRLRARREWSDRGDVRSDTCQMGHHGPSHHRHRGRWCDHPTEWRSRTRTGQ
ncbi:MAG: inositol monophosphatase family protein [Microthrixaceae bacterium]